MIEETRKRIAAAVAACERSQEQIEQAQKNQAELSRRIDALRATGAVEDDRKVEELQVAQARLAMFPAKIAQLNEQFSGNVEALRSLFGDWTVALARRHTAESNRVKGMVMEFLEGLGLPAHEVTELTQEVVRVAPSVQHSEFTYMQFSSMSASPRSPESLIGMARNAINSVTGDAQPGA